jgi:hypothetical protein
VTFEGDSRSNSNRDDLDSTRISYQQAYNGFYTVVFGLNIHIVLSMIIFLLIKKMKLNYGVHLYINT